MAMAENTTVVVKVEKAGVNLSLDKDEALTLALILANVGGSPAGPRGHSQAIFDELVRIGIEYTTHPSYSPSGIRGHILFED